jgi:alkanesulfonate monooxygenase SsuD/methylene tetrahydromethanopterin reductase-like flavin-dependent oxidoreductase (luciferase family)
MKDGMIVKVGISLTSAYATPDARRGARMMIERAAAARRAGLDSLFLGDHHSTGSPYYQNVPMLGRLLAEWGDAPAGCLFLLPLWQPVLVAEQVGTLAAIAQGRFILQCGIGDGAEQFDAMGANLKHRPSAFEEGLDAVRRLLAGETVRSHGRYHFDNARIAPRPPDPVEVWIGATAEPAVDRAARLGDAGSPRRGSSWSAPGRSPRFTWSAAARTAARRARWPSAATSTSGNPGPMSRRPPGPSWPGGTGGSIPPRSSRGRSTRSCGASAPSARWATPTSSSAI